MTESESVALPLGDAPIFSTLVIITDFFQFVNSYSQIFLIIFQFFSNLVCTSFILAKKRQIYLLNLKKDKPFAFFRFTFCQKCGKIHCICPWHSWIARQTPTLKVSGSNPLGQAKTKADRKAVCFRFALLNFIFGLASLS